MKTPRGFTTPTCCHSCAAGNVCETACSSSSGVGVNVPGSPQGGRGVSLGDASLARGAYLASDGPSRRGDILEACQQWYRRTFG